MWLNMKRIIFQILVYTIVGLLGIGGIATALAAMPSCGGKCCCMGESDDAETVFRSPVTAHTCCSMDTAAFPCEWRQSAPNPNTATLVSTIPSHDAQFVLQISPPPIHNLAHRPTTFSPIGAAAADASSAPPLFIANQAMLC